MSDILRDFDKKNETPKYKTDLADEITQALGIIGIYVSVGLTNEEMHLNKLDFSEHDKVFEDKIAELEKQTERLMREKQLAYDRSEQLMKTADILNSANKELKQRIAELENFSCQAEQETESLVEKLNQRIAELESKETETCENEPISDDCRPSMEWYENRHQSDCIEISRLNTTIDVLIHKVEYLRQFAGLE